MLIDRIAKEVHEAIQKSFADSDHPDDLPEVVVYMTHRFYHKVRFQIRGEVSRTAYAFIHTGRILDCSVYVAGSVGGTLDDTHPEYRVVTV